jgi:endonuclease/exonuclease/phosphatase family metal-dependent hydrolase
MRKFVVTLAAALCLGVGAAISSSSTAQASTSDDGPCAARAALVNTVAVHWFAAPTEDGPALEAWCRAVGGPIITPAPSAHSGHAPLEDLVVVSWNAHLADGELKTLIDDLRSGALTSGRPVERFVLLLQELYRRGDAVPAFAPTARSAYAIVARNPHAPDAGEYAEALGLSFAYFPSMRNGAALTEDRGNAIISTEPLEDLFALELPFERQRRVAAGATIGVQTARGVERLHVIDTHLEPLASPSSLWVLRNPRKRQVGALLDLVQQPRFADASLGTIIGGDFNTVQGGVREEAYRRMRAWSTSLASEDPRATHFMGRLDYVFARLDSGWEISTTRVDRTYGSDHHPVLARFHSRQSSVASRP